MGLRGINHPHRHSLVPSGPLPAYRQIERRCQALNQRHIHIINVIAAVHFYVPLGHTVAKGGFLPGLDAVGSAPVLVGVIHCPRAHIAARLRCHTGRHGLALLIHFFLAVGGVSRHPVRHKRL